MSLLVPLISAEEDRSHKLRNRMLRRVADASEEAAVNSAAAHPPELVDGQSKNNRYLANGEKRKRRKKNKKKDKRHHDATSTATIEEETTTTVATTTDAPKVTLSTTSTEVTTTVTEPTATAEATMASTNASIDVQRGYLLPSLDNSNTENINMQSTNLHVEYLYTYGAPSVVKGSSMSNPNNACINGLRIYTEDVKDVTCSWYNKLWCNSGRKVTNVDFASQVSSCFKETPFALFIFHQTKSCELPTD